MKTAHLDLINGLSTRLLDTGGSGPTVVLVHGLANSVEVWERVLPGLQKQFRVIAFDLPGFGLASKPDAAYDAQFFADQLEAVLNTLKLDRVNLVGSSLGASAILRFSGQGLARIDKAVLAAPGGFGRQTHWLMRIPALPLVGARLASPTPFNNATTIRLAMHDPANATRELIALTNRHAATLGSQRSFVRTLKSGVGLLGSKDQAAVMHLAQRFDRPGLVIWGRQDRVFPFSQGVRAAELLPRSELLLLDACGHYPQWEQPAAFVSAVETFCA